MPAMLPMASARGSGVPSGSTVGVGSGTPAHRGNSFSRTSLSKSRRPMGTEVGVGLGVGLGVKVGSGVGSGEAVGVGDGVKVGATVIVTACCAIGA